MLKYHYPQTSVNIFTVNFCLYFTVTHWADKIMVGHGSTCTDPWPTWPIQKSDPFDPLTHCLLWTPQRTRCQVCYWVSVLYSWENDVVSSVLSMYTRLFRPRSQRGKPSEPAGGLLSRRLSYPTRQTLTLLTIASGELRLNATRHFIEWAVS